MRSSTIASRKALTSKAGMITVVPAVSQATSSWLLQPVTWKSGTEISWRSPGSSGSAMTRRAVSVFDRKFAWVVIAPFGNPVVPLV